VDDVEEFYDGWAEEYDALYSDWPSAVRQSGAALAHVLAACGVAPRSTVLDCTCGIGTQVIGLALHGYTVTGTDLSPKSIERARREAAAFGVAAAFDVSDVRAQASTDHAGLYDAVISCNSLTHLIDDGDLHRAVAAMAATARPGGLVLVTNRDYESYGTDRPRATPVAVSGEGPTRRASFQLWEWDDDGRAYTMERVTLTAGSAAGTGSDWTTRTSRTRLRALTRADVEHAMIAADLEQIQWHDNPNDQPVVTATRAV
jgi:glycine/sarcosine N-methyltransferase